MLSNVVSRRVNSGVRHPPVAGLMKRTFQLLIILNWLSAIAGVVISLTTRSTLPLELTAYLEHSGQTPLNNFDVAVFLVDILLLITCVIDAAGLFYLRRWARTLLVPLYVVGILLIPTIPAYVETGWAKMAFSISSIIGGMIIASAYFSPISGMFDQPPNV